MTESDHELMHRCREGDPAAFDALVRRWEGRVARILRSIGAASSGGVAVDVEDLSQEVFIRVLGSRDRYHNGCAFSTWLYRIAVNVARDANRRRQARWRALGNHRPRESSPEQADHIVSRQELGDRVAAAMRALPDELREPLMLKQFGEITIAEVAQILELPTSTVKSRVHAALVRLRSELRRRGVDETELQA